MIIMLMGQNDCVQRVHALALQSLSHRVIGPAIHKDGFGAFSQQDGVSLAHIEHTKLGRDGHRAKCHRHQKAEKPT